MGKGGGGTERITEILHVPALSNPLPPPSPLPKILLLLFPHMLAVSLDVKDHCSVYLKDESPPPLPRPVNFGRVFFEVLQMLSKSICTGSKKSVQRNTKFGLGVEIRKARPQTRRTFVTLRGKSHKEGNAVRLQIFPFLLLLLILLHIELKPGGA